jgi:serine phosphatase RsbU (regulator of sigma subunit)
MKKAMKQIPKHYVDEFLKQQAALIKSRTQLATLLFIFSFFAGSIISSFALHKGFSRQLVLTWILTMCVSSLMFIVSRKVSRIQAAKVSAVTFMVMCLGVLARYYIMGHDAPFNVGMVYIFAFLGFSLMFPWSPNEVAGVFILHCGAYAIYLLHTRTYLYKGTTVIRELPDYLQGYIIMLMSFFLCHIVSKRERMREVENYILLKEVEEKNKQMQHELELATRVHSRLIPHSVSTRLADIAVTYVPMYYMGGDYAKFLFLDKNKLIFIICDVTGHGVSAALLVNAFNTEFERLAKEGKAPGALLKEMDRFIVKNFAQTGMYLTAFCGFLEYGHFSRRFLYSSYGHPPQYVYRAAHSEIEKIPAQTSLLGLPLEDETVYQNEIPFNKGDRIVLFTDGVTEAKDAGGTEYGDEKLERFIRRNSSVPAQAFNEKLLNELNAFAENRIKDDIFILNIQTK